MSDFNADTVVPSIETGNGSALNNAKNSIANSKVSDSFAFRRFSITDIWDIRSKLYSYSARQLTICPDASAAADAIKNHPITQSVTNGTNWSLSRRKGAS